MKALSIILLTCCLYRADAAIHNVTVSNFQFSPSNLNVLVGDVICWQWSEGLHNTVSLVVPPGAVPWSSPDLAIAGNTFSYTITAAGSYQYECAYHSGFMTAGFTASGAVPVLLSSFAVANLNNRPRITWTTEQESNTDFFAIRRSYDGAIFTEIGRVPAAGNSTVVRNYTFIDATAKHNVKFVYYEILITDKDGSTQLSPIRLFKNNAQISKLITAMSPNPVQQAGHLMIRFNGDAPGRLMAKVLDINGRLMLAKELYAAVGVNNGHIHLGDLAQGNYIIHFSLNGVEESYKVKKK